MPLSWVPSSPRPGSDTPICHHCSSRHVDVLPSLGIQYPRLRCCCCRSMAEIPSPCCLGSDTCIGPPRLPHVEISPPLSSSDVVWGNTQHEFFLTLLELWHPKPSCRYSNLPMCILPLPCSGPIILKITLTNKCLPEPTLLLTSHSRSSLYWSVIQLLSDPSPLRGRHPLYSAKAPNPILNHLFLPLPYLFTKSFGKGKERDTVWYF